MTTLRLVSVNSNPKFKRSVSTKASSTKCALCSQTPLPSFLQKALLLYKDQPHAAAVLERVMDHCLSFSYSDDTLRQS